MQRRHIVRLPSRPLIAFCPDAIASRVVAYVPFEVLRSLSCSLRGV